eukprot:jgi/Chlat1/363/Chrsp10S01484
MCTPSAARYWRAAGMSYLKYANISAGMLRAALKESVRAKLGNRDAVHYKSTVWEGGKPVKTVIHEGEQAAAAAE